MLANFKAYISHLKTEVCLSPLFILIRKVEDMVPLRKDLGRFALFAEWALAGFGFLWLQEW